MKILYVIEHISTQGGLERILIDKMNALANEPGCEVVLMTVWHDENAPAFPMDARVGQVCLGLARRDSRAERASLLPLERNACLPGCVWNATPRSLSPLERNIGFWTQA